MASYNHMPHHAAGGWNTNTDNNVHHHANQVSASTDTTGIQDMSIDPMDHHHYDKYHKNNTTTTTSSSFMPPPQTTSVTLKSQSVSINDWRGLMTVPRAVSHDQSDDLMDVSPSGSRASTSRQSTSTMDFTATSPKTNTSTNHNTRSATTGNAAVATTPTSVHRRDHQSWNVSPLTQDESNTSASSVVGRYDCVEEQDVNRTAYFSASGISSEHNQETTPHRPTETSTAISLSSSEKSVGDIYDTTSLTLEHNDSDDQLPSQHHLSQIIEEAPEETNHLELKELSSPQAEANNHKPMSASSSLPSSIHPTSSQSPVAVRNQSIFVARRTNTTTPPGNNNQSSDIISLLRSKEEEVTPSSSLNNHPTTSSQISSIQQASSSSTSMSPTTQISSSQQQQPPQPLWRDKSILDKDEIFKGSSSSSLQGEEEKKQVEATTGAVMEEGTKTGNNISGQEDGSNLESFHQDPLFQVHELSNNERTSKSPAPKDDGLSYPLSAFNASVNLSLGHYLSSCSSSESPARTREREQSIPEPRCEEGTTVLSDIDVSRWTTGSSSVANDDANLLEGNSTTKNNQDEVNSDASIASQHQLSMDAPRTPQKPEMALDANDFNSPTTTARKNSLHISLEESTAYVTRIEALEEELAKAKRAIREQREFYDEQLAQQHAFTMPLHPHSPFDPHTNQKHSPGTQQRKLLERNQTLLKEVRFADQTCVELSEQKAALQSQLEQLQQGHKEAVGSVQAKSEALAQQLELDKRGLEQQLRGANEDKGGLERQLHAAYDKLDLKTKELQTLQSQQQHASDGFESMRQSIVSQKDGIILQLQEQVKGLDAQHKHACDMQQRELQDMASKMDQQKHAQEMQQRGLQDLAAERDNLQAHVEELASHKERQQQELQDMASERDKLEAHAKELASFKTSYYTTLREKEVVSERMNRLSTAVSEANHALLVSQQERDETTQKLESSKKECRSMSWKLKETEQKLQEVSELKDHLAAKNEFSQQQVASWKLQAETLQKELDKALEAEAKLQSQSDLLSRVSSRESQSKAEESEGDFWREEAQYAKKVEVSVSQMNEALSTAINKILAHEGTQLIESCGIGHKKKVRGQQVAAKVNPSLLSHYLATSKSLNGEILSPQVIQILQLILTFTQQHLDVIDQKVEQITSEYSVRIAKQLQLVNHIRSSLVFEDESEEGPSGKRDENKAKEICLDATFAAVTSIPDQKVELMEEARSNDAGDKIVLVEGALNSPARDTILDLSKIEAVNSPFYSSDITFSIDSEPENGMLDKPEDRRPALDDSPQQKNRLGDVQRKVFLEPLDLGTKELELLRNTITCFQKDFLQHRAQLRTFVEAQQAPLKQMGDDTTSNAAQISRLVEERNALLSDLTKAQGQVNECNEKIRACALDLAASERSKERLANENVANRKRITTLQNDLVDMEHRLLGNSRSSNDPWPRDRPPSRRNSFQERLEASISETSSSETTQDFHQLRSELADATRMRDAHRNEVSRLQKALRESEDAHGNLKLSFVSSNEKLAAAAEMAEKHKLIAEQLKESKQKESQLRDELSRLATQVQELSRLAADQESALKASEGLEERLRQAQWDYQSVQNLLDEAEKDKATLQSEFDTLQKAQVEVTKLQEAALEAASSKEHALKEISRLEKELQSAQKSYDQLKAAATEELESQSALVDEKGSLELQLKELNLATQVLESARESQEKKAAEAIRKIEDGQQELLQKNATLQNAHEEVTKFKKAASYAASCQKELSNKATQLEQELSSTQESYEQLRENYVACNDKLASVTEQLGSQTALAADRETLEMCLKQAEEQLACVKDELERMRAAQNMNAAEAASSQQQHTKESNRLELELRENQDAHNQLKLNFVSTNEKLADASEQMESLSDLVMEKDKSLKHAEDEIVRLRQEADSVSKKLELARESQNALVKEKQNLAKDLEQAWDEAGRISEEMLNKVNASAKELEQVKEQQLALIDQKQCLEARLQDAEETVARNHDDMVKLESRLKEKDAALKESRQESTALRSELADMSKAKDCCLSEINNLQEALQQSEQSLGNLKVSYVAANNKLAEKANDIEDFTQRLCDSEGVAAHLEQDNAAMKEAESHLNNEIATLKDGHENISKQLQHRDEELASIRKTCEETTEKMQLSVEAEEKLGNEIASLKEARRELEARLSSTEQQLQDGARAQEQLHNESEVIKNERDGFLKELREADQERDAMREGIEATRQKLDEITSELGNDLKHSNAELLKALAECENLRGQMKKQKEGYDAEIDFLKLNKEDLEVGFENLKLSFVSCQDKLANLLDHNSNNESVIEELKAACDAAEGLTESTERRLLECRSELETTLKERGDLEHELRQSREKLELATKEYNQLKASKNQRDVEMIQATEKLKQEKEEALRATQGELAGFATELQSLRKEMTLSLALFNGEVPSRQDLESSHNAGSRKELQLLKVSIPSLCEALEVTLDRLKATGQQSYELNEEVGHLRVIESELRTALEEEKVLSEELASQLSQAQAKIEFSSRKVTRLHNALEEARAAETDERRKAVWIETARQEALVRYESELGLKTEAGDETEAKLYECESKFMDLTSKFVKAENELSSCKERLAAAQEDLKVKEQSLIELVSQKESWETRCQKLRAYMRKITVKCEEWEASYGQQSKVLEELYNKYKALLKEAQLKRLQPSELEPFRQPMLEETVEQHSTGSPRSAAQLEEHLSHYAADLQNITWSS